MLAMGALLAASAACHARDVQRDPVGKYRTTNKVHGLYEIRAEGQRFLRIYNRRHRTDWVGFGPDIRMQVERCLTPLRSRWVRESDRMEAPGVMVLCDKSIDKRRWDAFVQAYRPSQTKR